MLKLNLIFLYLVFHATGFSQQYVKDISFTNSPGINEFLQVCVSLPDGEQLIAGAFSYYNGHLMGRIGKIFADGSIDTTFNPAGTGANNCVRDFVIQPDGKIVIVGDFTSYNGVGRNRVARIHSDGTLDTTFNPGTGTNFWCFSVSLQSDGKILVSGLFDTYNGNNSRSLVRINSDGSFDNSFTSGVPGNTIIYGVDVLADEKILICGGFTSYGGNSYKNIVRLSPDGSLDPEFNVSGNVWGNGSITTMSVQPDGQILILGDFSNYNGVFCKGMASLNPDGTMSIPFIANNAEPLAILATFCVLPNGQILAAGTDFKIFRFNPDGTYDATFTPMFANNSITCIALQAEDRILVGGRFTTFNNQNEAGIIQLRPCIPTYSTDEHTSCNSYTWIDGNTYAFSNNTASYTLVNADGCDSIITLDLTINQPTFATQTEMTCGTFTWPVNGETFTVSGSYTDTIPNNAACDSIITLNLTVIQHLPLEVNTYSQSSDANACTGQLAISTTGNAPFALEIDNDLILTSNSYILTGELCPGIHSVFTTDYCGDTLTTNFIIPTDSNYIFNNAFIDSLSINSLGVTIENCEIYYNGIDTAYIADIFTNGNELTVTWIIVDANGMSTQTSTYGLNNGSGVYNLQLSVFCPQKALGQYFVVTQTVYFDGTNVQIAGLKQENQILKATLFPNPTTEMVTITFAEPWANLIICDTQGKLISLQTIASGSQIAMTDLQSGLYFFALSTENGRVVKRVTKY